MLSKLTSILKEAFTDTGGNVAANEVLYRRAMAGLLCEVASADHQFDMREESAKVHMLMSLLEMTEDDAEQLVNAARLDSQNAVSLYDYTDKLRQLDQSQRYALIKAMWEVAFADGAIDPMEESVIRKTAELLYVDHALFIKAKLATVQNG